MAHSVSEADIVISTAAVPGKKAPILISDDMVAGMEAGSIVVDLAASRGGNCSLTRPDEVVVHQGVTILGPTNLTATLPVHASQMYANNMVNVLKHLVKNGQCLLDLQDQITREMLVMREGVILNPRVRELLGLPELESPDAAASTG
jgi:NAD(P) transhydrogenase subunit alpha